MRRAVCQRQPSFWFVYDMDTHCMHQYGWLIIGLVHVYSLVLRIRFTLPRNPHAISSSLSPSTLSVFLLQIQKLKTPTLQNASQSVSQINAIIHCYPIQSTDYDDKKGQPAPLKLRSYIQKFIIINFIIFWPTSTKPVGTSIHWKPENDFHRPRIAVFGYFLTNFLYWFHAVD